ncbi:MAG: hypothetical protein GH155_00115 [Spirochaeta sp.]|nr:hypothetical protein [Spirochaeta sp.]
MTKKHLTYFKNAIIPVRMSKIICKVLKTDGNFRINVPKKIIREKLWGDVLYVILEDHWPDKVVIRRLFDEKDLKSEDH